jgi:hypothetical protein
MSNGFVSYLSVTETSTNSAANTSVVTYTLWINPPGNYTSYNLNSGDQSYTVTINGTQVASGGFTYDFRSPNENTNKTIKTGTVTITHNTNGSKTVAASATVNTASATVGDASIASFDTVLTDFVRTPTVPSLSSLTRSSDGATVTASYTGSTFYGTSGSYEYQWSTDNSTWSSPVSSGSGATVSPTATIYVQGRATDSEGDGVWSGSTTIIGIPTAPASISAVRNARNVTVTAGSSTGSSILGYSVQYSTNGGSSWSSPVVMTSQVYTYLNLPAALTYLFRVYSGNTIGNSAYTTTASGIYVAAGGKRWDGSAWVSTATAKRWDGSAWVDITSAKRWSGSAWVDLS